MWRISHIWHLDCHLLLRHVLVLEAVGLYPCSYVEPVIVMTRNYLYPFVMSLNMYVVLSADPEYSTVFSEQWPSKQKYNALFLRLYYYFYFLNSYLKNIFCIFFIYIYAVEISIPVWNVFSFVYIFL
jgi:hypothetical protein